MTTETKTAPAASKATKADEAKPFATRTLPSGKVAALPREPVLKDLEMAYGVATRLDNPITRSAALLAVTSGTINGKEVFYEQLQTELSGVDAYDLAIWMTNGYAPS